MNHYEKLLEIMRKQGKKDNPPILQIADVQNNGVVKVGSLYLEEGDYMKSDTINELIAGDNVLMYQLSESKYIAICKVVN